MSICGSVRWNGECQQIPSQGPRFDLFRANDSVSSRYRNPARFAGTFLLLAAISADCAEEGLNCVPGLGGTGWLCADQDPETSSNTTPTRTSATTPPAATTGAAQASTLDTSLLHEGLDWEYCGPRPLRLGPAVLPPRPTAEDRLFLSADTFDYDQELDLLWLSGDVRGTQGNRFVAANKVVYGRNTSDLVAQGNIFLANPGVRLIADRAQLNLGSDQGRLFDVHYRFTGEINAHGNADQAEQVRPTLTRYQNITYSTCRPGRQDWSLDAAKLELDQAKGWGVALNTKLRVRGLPVFYTPYFSFPIDNRRKSGFLVPTFGSSERNGIELTVPYYWNIAPQMDIAFFPRYLGKRGPMLGTEFRYLSPRQRVRFFGEILSEDSQVDRQDRGARWALRIEQAGSFGRRWSTRLKYNAVSDDEYFEDFGTRLEQTSTRNIERRGDLNYSGMGWFLRTRLQEYQTLDATLAPASQPYARLPQLIFGINRHHRVDSGIELGVSGEYDYFHHDTRVHGHRATLLPFARWPLRKPYGHLTPQLNLYLAGYDLRNQQPDKDAHPSYVIPSFNLDAELVFERTVKWFDQESLQTLEPRLFYLYTPFTEQEDTPDFDTSRLSFSYDNLFRLNRFSGWDRIGDANQVTLGLTSRTLARDSGRELLRASIGQILYARDREVQLSGPPEEESSSSVAGLLSTQFLRNWSGRVSFQYDPNQESDRLRKQTLELHYQTPDNRLFNLAYRTALGTGERTLYENTDLSFSLPVNRQLQLVGRWNYSLLDSQTVETFAGLEYGRCCWRVRLLSHYLKNKPDSAGTNSIMIQVELAGLGSPGQRVDKFLERDIYGYSVH